MRTGWLLLPLMGAAGFHAACLRFDWFSFLRRPIDGGLCWRGRRVFGDNKTWRGILAVACGTSLIFALQAEALHELDIIRRLEFFDYGAVNGLVIGFMLGAAAELSELPNSFVKRQAGIPPGKTAGGWLAAVFFLWDQIDILLGYWLVLSLHMDVTLPRLLLSVILVMLVHPVFSVLGLILGVRQSAR